MTAQGFTLCNTAPFPATRECEQPKHGLTGAEELEPPPPIDRSGERSALTTCPAFRPPRGRSVQDFVAGAAFLVIWGALWSLLIFSYQSPLENADVDESVENSEAVPVLPSWAPYQRKTWDAQTQVFGDSASVDDPPLPCRAGMVELDGRCVSAEEIEVSPPAGSTRR